MKCRKHLLPKYKLILNSSNIYSSGSIKDTTCTAYIHLYIHSHMLYGKLSVRWSLGALSGQGGMQLQKFFEAIERRDFIDK